MSGKTVCVVGAGQSGLISIKECLAQSLKPTCYELDSDVGGLWKFKDANSKSNGVTLWSNFITNTSKWANTYSDFPPDPKDPPYQNQEQLYHYHQQYAKHFNLNKYIHFNTRVVWIRKSPDHDTTGRWEVFTCPTEDFRGGDKSSQKPGTRLDAKEREDLLVKCKKETYDFIVICSGYFKYPVYPDIPGSSTFKGKIYHAFTYHSPKDFDNKNVLVVGNKLSAMDICDDLATCAKQAYLGVGEGTWILPRVYPGGCTREQLISRSLVYHPNAKKIINDWVVTTAQSRLDHKALGIVPNKEPRLAPKGYGDGLAVKIMSGRVKVFGRLTSLTENEAHFRDGSVIPNLDAIVYCTGYGADLSFLDSEIIAPNGKMEMYKMIFPVKEKHNTLAFVGIIGTDAAYIIISEMQARLATSVMARQITLPPKPQMQKDANHWNELNWQIKKNYNYFIPGFPLMDAIAIELGVYPSFWKIFYRDPVLAYRVWYGSVVAAHYRLLGPNSNWELARKICHEQYEERAKCLCNIQVPKVMSIDGNKNGTFFQWFKIISISAMTCGFAFAVSQLKFPEVLADMLQK